MKKKNKKKEKRAKTYLPFVADNLKYVVLIPYGYVSGLLMAGPTLCLSVTCSGLDNFVKDFQQNFSFDFVKHLLSCLLFASRTKKKKMMMKFHFLHSEYVFLEKN